MIVVAATNRVDVLDPALTRPGRFDRQVYVPLPDVKGRMEILKVHSRKVKLGPNVDLLRLAQATPGLQRRRPGRDHQRSRAGRDAGGQGIHRAGRPGRSARQGPLRPGQQEPRDRREGKARHRLSRGRPRRRAVAAATGRRPDPQGHDHPPRPDCGGATMTLPEKDRTQLLQASGASRSSRCCFGGRIAEEMFTGDINTGALRRHPPGHRHRPPDGPRLGHERPPRLRLLRRRRQHARTSSATSAAAANTPKKPPR